MIEQSRTMANDAYEELAQLACEWIKQLRATEPGELWWENWIDALVDLEEPAVPLLAEQLGDQDRTIGLGVAKAIERIARSMQRRQAGAGRPSA